MSKVQKKQTNLREKLAELLDFRKMRDRLSGLGLYVGKDRTNTDENLLVRGGANVDDLQLAEISAAVGGTAVDVFVYDTSRDSDGGKWRERTQHTSWYNEGLNTATRGGRREFPAVALIVAEEKKVTIYDGDDPDLGMWMVFNRGSGTDITNDFSHIGPSNVILSSIHALNSQIFIAGEFGSDMLLFQVKLINDHTIGWFTNSARLSSTNISKRNANTLFTNQVNSVGIISTQINDVAMTILPNAPIDEDTGLPVPTIAVAADGGVSVIRDDGTVVDIVSDNLNGETPLKVDFRGRLLYLLLGSKEDVSNSWNSVSTIYIPDGDVLTTYRDSGDYIAQYSRYNGLPLSEPGNSGHDMLVPINSQTHLPLSQRSRAINVLGTDHLYIGGEGSEDKAGGVASIFENLTNPKNGLIAYTTSKYNTGWMPGDIKLAALSDSVVENVGVNSDEIIQNGESWTIETGSTAPTEWIEETDGSATFSLLSGELTITQTGTAPAKIYQAFDVIKGRVYNIEARIKRGSSGIARFQITNNSTGAGSYFLLSDITSTTYQTITKQIRAEETGQYSVAITCYTSGGGGGGSAVFDYVRARATTELITNGDFSTDSDWTKGEGWSIVGGVASKVSSTNSSNLTQEIDCVIGQTYVVSWDITSRDSSAVGFYTQGGGSITAVQNYYESVGSYSETFTATSGSVTIALRAGSTAVLSIDNISVRPAEEDRSVNGNGLQIVGEIQKTPVASGADLVAYSGFSANNYLVQPYNEDLNFGTGDFSVMGWVKLNDSYGTNVGSIVAIADPSIKFYFKVDHSTGAFSLFLNDVTKITSQYTASSGNWAFATVRRSNGKLSISVNAQKNDTDVDYANSIDMSSDQETSIGYRLSNNDAELAGSLALLRISKTAPTDAQIAKIYRDEKVLFQDGAQVTLYGSSDATTALSYDEKTELLHVGTSAGRSDFSGLRRINNTTTAITTSISAHNNLIAEQ
jgi:hypothetical protein